MITDNSLVFYKSKVAIAKRDGDKLELVFNKDPSIRVRDKDVELICTGPIKTIPEPKENGEFETAWEMVSGQELTLKEISSLAFGEESPSTLLASRLEVAKGNLFRIKDGKIYALSETERANDEAKRQKKQNEASERQDFYARAKQNKFEAGDERFWGEIASIALGQSQKSKTAVDLGIKETAEAAHAWLLKTGLWTSRTNPFPLRIGHPSKAPVLKLGEDDDDGRIDLCNLESWAIDNAWSNDPDDAVSCDGQYIYVHVADPASTITPDSPIDIEASNRSGTLYLPEGTIPMLPDEALERFGLGLSERSRALSFKIEIEDSGLIKSVEVFPSFIKVTRSNYEEADKLLDNAVLSKLMHFAEIRRKYRMSNNAVDIDIPETHIWVKDGKINIEPTKSYKSSMLVSEMMILAGEGFARWAFDNNLPFPYYSQEAPGTMEKLPEGLAGQFAQRRLMKAGMAGVQPRAHQGLGVSMYAQATSPLRRYGDLLGHQQARAFLAEKRNNSNKKAINILPSDHLSMKLARAQAGAIAVKKAERASVMHWILAYLLERPKEQYKAIIVYSGGNETTIFIPSIGLETKIAFTDLPLNTEILVKFLKADLATQKVTFETC